MNTRSPSAPLQYSIRLSSSLSRSTARIGAVDKRAALSNAVAGVRLAGIVECNHMLAAWWLRGVREGMCEDVDFAQRTRFLPRSNQE